MAHGYHSCMAPVAGRCITSRRYGYYGKVGIIAQQVPDLASSSHRGGAGFGIITGRFLAKKGRRHQKHAGIKARQDS